MADNATDRTPAVTIPLPRLDAGLIVNLFAVASLAAICVMVGFLTDWRWGGLLAGVLGFAAAVYVSRNLPEPARHAEVKPLKKAG